jgi:hypothetical protein
MKSRGVVHHRGPRRGDAVEKRPTGAAERDAARAEDNVPLDARTKQPIEHGRMERPERGETDAIGRRGLADMGEPEPQNS